MVHCCVDGCGMCWYDLCLQVIQSPAQTAISAQATKAVEDAPKQVKFGSKWITSKVVLGMAVVNLICCFKNLQWYIAV